jgi:hypothetical protein
MLFLTAVGAISGLTILLATALVLANRKLYVYEDPRIDVVEEMLPHANCGACGFPGCRPFAEALTQGKALPGKCTVGSSEERAAIATFLGVDVGAEEKTVARLACAGGTNVARNHARYHGEQSCRAAAQVHSVRRLCRSLPKGPVFAAQGESSLVGGLQLTRSRRRDPRRLRGRLHDLRPVRDGCPERPHLDAEESAGGGLQQTARNAHSD